MGYHRPAKTGKGKDNDNVAGQNAEQTYIVDGRSKGVGVAVLGGQGGKAARRRWTGMDFRSDFVEFGDVFELFSLCDSRRGPSSMPYFTSLSARRAIEKW